MRLNGERSIRESQDGDTDGTDRDTDGHGSNQIRFRSVVIRVPIRVIRVHVVLRPPSKPKTSFFPVAAELHGSIIRPTQGAG